MKRPDRENNTPRVEDKPLGEALSDIEETMPGFARWMYRTVRPKLGRRVLDAGAGLGTYTNLLVEDGKEVVSLEYNAAFATHIQERFAGDARVDARQCDLSDPGGLPDFAPVESVVCLNVLEHIKDDVRALRNIRERVLPEGAMMALVPSYQRLFNGMDRAVGHHRRYSKQLFVERLRDGGWTVESIRYFNVFGLPGWFVAGSLLRRATPGRDLTRIFDKMVPVFSVVEKTLVRGTFGLSLLATCRRAD
jgi:SAM-dependent methyltransferase